MKLRRPGGTGFLKILIVGGYGSGKTHFIGSAAAELKYLQSAEPEKYGNKRILLLSVDPGDLTLADCEGSELIDVPDREDFSGWNDFNSVYAWLMDEGAIKDYWLVAIDDLYTAQDWCMREIMAEALKKNSDRNPDVPDIRDWGMLGSRMKKLIRFYRDLPAHIIHIALPKDMRDDKTGTVYVRPAQSGQLATTLGAFYDVVGYLSTRTTKTENATNIERVMQFFPDKRVSAKDRTRKLGDFMFNPSFGKMLKAVRENQPSDKAPAMEPKITRPKPKLR
jgi:hypothetical protein